MYHNLNPNSSKAKPRPNPLPHPLPILLYRLHILLRIHIRLEIHLARPPELRLLHNLPHQYHAHENRQLQVEADEIHRSEFRTERRPALHQDNEDVQHDAQDGSDGVGPVPEREQVFFPLRFQAGAEAEGGDADADPGELVRHADDVLQPGPDLARAGEGEGEEDDADERGCQDGYPGDLVAG